MGIIVGVGTSHVVLTCIVHVHLHDIYVISLSLQCASFKYLHPHLEEVINNMKLLISIQYIQCMSHIQYVYHLNNWNIINCLDHKSIMRNYSCNSSNVITVCMLLYWHILRVSNVSTVMNIGQLCSVWLRKMAFTQMRSVWTCILHGGLMWCWPIPTHMLGLCPS